MNLRNANSRIGIGLAICAAFFSGCGSLAQQRKVAPLSVEIQKMCSNRDVECQVEVLERIWRERSWERREEIIIFLSNAPPALQREYGRKNFDKVQEIIPRGFFLEAWLENAKPADFPSIISLLTDSRCAGRENSTINELVLEFLIFHVDFEPTIDIVSFIKSPKYQKEIRSKYNNWLDSNFGRELRFDSEIHMYFFDHPDKKRLSEHLDWLNKIYEEWGKNGGMARPSCPEM